MSQNPKTPSMDDLDDFRLPPNIDEEPKDHLPAKWKTKYDKERVRPDKWASELEKDKYLQDRSGGSGTPGKENDAKPDMKTSENAGK